jgi:N-acetyl-gamma-glutamyl-phosphate reductase
MALRASVLGASGYTGGELLRLLAGHPALEPGPAAAGARSGEQVGAVQPHLHGAVGGLVSLEEGLHADADVCFSCLPSGQLRRVAGDVAARAVVDLSDDFRLRGQGDAWAYGLTEFAREEAASASRIANPGCYPTAALLCLVPFWRAGLVHGPIIVDALSGLSGAGRRAEDRLLFAAGHANAGAYGTTEHRHVPEIEQGLERFGGIRTTVSFTPHLVPMARGLVVTARVRLKTMLDDGRARQVLRDAFDREPFVEVVDDWPQTKAVSGTNRAHVSARVDARNALLIASCAIDNLGKGAAGQAIQNANLMLGLDETTGLDSSGVWP